VGTFDGTRILAVCFCSASNAAHAAFTGLFCIRRVYNCFVTFSARVLRYLMLVAGTGIGLVSTCAAQSNSLSLSVNSVSTAGFVSLNLSLSSAAASLPAALQWTSNYSASDIVGSTAIEGPAAIAAGKTVTCSGNRCLLWGLNMTVIPNGVVAVLTFQLASTVSGNVAFQLTDVLAASPLADPIFLSIANGRIAVVTQPITFPPDVAAGLAVIGSVAQIASSGGWDTTISLVNTGSTTAHARLKFFDDDGSGLSLPLTFPRGPDSTSTLFAASIDQAISPGAMLVTDSTGPDVLAVQQGAAQLSTDGGINGFAILRDRFNNWEAAVPLETRNAASYLLAFDNSGGLATGLAVANLSAQPANVQVTVRDDTGTQIGSALISLPGLGHTSFMLDQNYPITAAKRGTVEFDTPTGGQISVLGLRINSTSTTAIPVLANVDASGGSVAHVTFNGSFATQFTLVNLGNGAAPATLNFSDDNGHPLMVPLSVPQSGSTITTSTLTQTLAPGASLLIETQGQDSLPTVVGSAQLSTTGDVSGFAIFRWIPLGHEASVPLETRSANAYVLAFDNTDGLTTGLALSNVANLPGDVMVNVRDEAGMLIQSDTISLPAQGHTSFMLPDRYATAAGKRGTVEFVTPTGGRTSALGFRTNADGTLTAIPVLAK
jgi:hypothetical protein